MSKNKVIFHIDELNKWRLLLKNVENLLDAVGDREYHVEVLANSEAVKIYNTNESLEVDISLLEKLYHRGVNFVACNNALKANNLKKEDLADFIEVVPVGVLELVTRQSEGYAYIRP